MLFNTFQFLTFFVVVVVFLCVAPERWRKPGLLVASYYFYMCWSVGYIAVIWAITLFDFVAGERIETANCQARRRAWLCASIVCNFGLLFAFKYFDFFAASASRASSAFGLGLSIPLLHLLLPVGISFHTFQAVSYTVEVYRRNTPAEKSLLNYALYVAFFPQMVAGPIERPGNLLPQFQRLARTDLRRVRSGCELALWGLFKKVAIADLLSPVVATVYSQPHQFPGPILLLATFFFTVQIYCDFSGYSEIAVGIARMLGYDLMINFAYPYQSKSISEFWRRWHISLSTWFRDYLYIPVGGSRVGLRRWAGNILLVFTVSGLWHGANWTFCIWGALHGLFLVFGRFTTGLRKDLRKWTGLERLPELLSAFQTACTFLLVMIAWVFFRAASVEDAFYISSHLLTGERLHAESLFRLGLPRFDMGMTFPLIAVLFLVEWLVAHPNPLGTRIRESRPARWACYTACAYGIVFFGVFKRVEFIYFQF